MVHQNSLIEKHEERFSMIFSTLQMGRSLRDAGIRKSFGMPALTTFKLIFTLVFQGRNWLRLLESEHRSTLPGKVSFTVF